MSSPVEASDDDRVEWEQAMRVELDRRIGELEKQATAGAGPKLLGTGDGILIGVLFLLIPAVLVYCFR